MLVLTTYATKNYCYALHAQRPAIARALAYAGVGRKDMAFVMAGDGSAESKAGFAGHVASLGLEKDRCVYVTSPLAEGKEKRHTDDGCRLIADMQERAWAEAVRLGAEQVWSLESDIIPQPKTLQCMMDTLRFDHGWYGVAMCTYPNLGFLGGAASDRNWIMPNVYPEERDLAESVKVRMDKKKEREKELRDAKQQPTEDDITEWKALDKDVENSPPHGNVWELNAKFGYKPRGWFEYQYPGIGMGAVLPTGWTGLGCTLIGRRALELANFSAYDGKGTQDLYLGRKCWIPNGIRLSVISHAVCDHIKPGANDGEYIRYAAFHSTEPSTYGHLRVNEYPFYANKEHKK